MESKLQIKTRTQKEEAGDEPVSPTGKYLTSKAISLCIVCVMEFEIPIDDSCAMDLLHNVFLPINPRFSSILVSDRKGVKKWKRVEVNLQDHIITPEVPPNLLMEEYDDLFDKYRNTIALKPMPQDRPLWEIHVIKYPTSKAAGHLIFKLHHAIGDGYSLMGALLSCFQRADNPSLPLTFPLLRRSSTAGTTKNNIIHFVPRALSSIYNAITDFAWSMLKSSFLADDKTPIRSGVENVEFRPVEISNVDLSLDQVAEIKRKLGVTVNDVLSAIIFLGTRLYMQETRKGSGRSKCTALVLLNTRNITGYKSVQEMLHTSKKSLWGNQFTFLHVKIPKLIDDKSLNPLDFVAHAHKIIKRKRNSFAVYLTGQSLHLLRKLGGSEAAAKLIHRTFKNSSITISNVIGPVEQMALANHPCKGLYFSVTGAPQNLVFCILSYMQTLRINILAEEDYIDVQKFRSCIENAYGLMCKAANETKIRA